jgi:S-adenosyl methyltransferase
VTDESASSSTTPAKVDTAVPHSARVWNYWLGGKDNFAADRAVGDQVRQIFPQIVMNARAQREFLTRVVRYLAGELQVRQFLDVGTGLPTAGNTHEVAQQVAPDSRVVYVDNDPVVLAHARALLTGAKAGTTAYIDVDVREPGEIVRAAALTLDFNRPTALMLLGILGHIGDHDEASSIVRQLVGALCPGSYLVVADGADVDEAGNEAQRRYNEAAPVPYHLRSPEQISAFFGGLDLLSPGVVPVSQWRPDPNSADEPADTAVFGGVARRSFRVGRREQDAG